MWRIIKKLLISNITAKYQKVGSDVTQNIDREAKAIAQSLKLDDRIEQFSKRKAFVTLKDHKPNFPNNPKCRLINPAKSEIGIISKIQLDKINSIIRSNTQLNQWRNTSAVISWFKDLPNKSACRFVKLDVVEFYPSIGEELFLKAISFAKEYTTIERETINLILHSRKSLLFDFFTAESPAYNSAWQPTQTFKPHTAAISVDAIVLSSPITLIKV